MRRTALAIIQRSRYREGLAAPSSIASTTDVNELQLKHVLYEVCEEIRQAQCWTQQKRRHSFTTVNAQASYQLPADFYAPITGTFWNDDQTIKLIGPVSDDEFDAKKYGSLTSSTNYTFRLFGYDENSGSAGGQLELNPTPSSAVDLGFSYLTSSTMLPPEWAASTAYTTGKYVNANGNNYICTTNGTSGSTAPSGTGTGIADGTAVWSYYGETYDTIQTDADLCLFDDDLVVLGLRAHWRATKKGEANQLMADFKKKIDLAKGRYNGSTVGSFAGRCYGPKYRVPYKTWSF